MFGTVAVLAAAGTLWYGFGASGGHEPGGSILRQPSRDDRDVELRVEFTAAASGVLTTWTLNGARAGHANATTSPWRTVVHTQRGKIVGMSASTVGEGRPVCTIFLPDGQVKQDNTSHENRSHCDVTAYVP